MYNFVVDSTPIADMMTILNALNISKVPTDTLI